MSIPDPLLPLIYAFALIGIFHFTTSYIGKLIRYIRYYFGKEEIVEEKFTVLPADKPEDATCTDCVWYCVDCRTCNLDKCIPYSVWDLLQDGKATRLTGKKHIKIGDAEIKIKGKLEGYKE